MQMIPGRLLVLFLLLAWQAPLWAARKVSDTPAPETPASTNIATEPDLILDVPEPPTAPTRVLPERELPALDAVPMQPAIHEVESASSSIDQKKWHFVLHGSANVAYDNNIFISRHDEVEDFRFVLAPAIAIGIGDFEKETTEIGSFQDRLDPFRYREQEPRNFLFAHIIPAFTLFAENSSEDSFDPDVDIEGQYVWTRLILGIQARFQRVNLPDADLGQLSSLSIYTGKVTTHYDFTSKTSFDLNFLAFGRDYDESIRIDSLEMRGEAWMNYRVQPKIQLSAGLFYGHVAVSEGAANDYEQVLARVLYDFSAKMRLDVTGGVEFRQIHGVDNPVNGVFGLGITWTPFTGTVISLQGYRRNSTSAGLPPAQFTQTGFDLRIRQRVFRRIFLNLATGYQNLEYEYYDSNLERSDDIFFIRPSVGFDILKWLSAEVGAEYRNDHSNSENFGFKDTTIYFQLNAFF